MKKFIYLIVILIPLINYAQKQGNIWYFSDKNGIDFNSGNPVLLINGQIPANPDFTEGTATISDSSGNLLFYATAERIWNRNHQLMPIGDSLWGGESSTQGVFIIPKPGSNTLFYVFTLGAFYNSDLKLGLRYSVVNMCLENGLGNIDSAKRNILLLDNTGEKQAATFHANGTDIWLVVHKYWSDAFYSYLITANGISNPVISHIGSYHPPNGNLTEKSIGQMKISPDGSKLALVASNMTPSIVELFNFDNSTGVISNYISLPPLIPCCNGTYYEYGVSFSPDNSKLYISSGGNEDLYQFDLSSGNASSIISSRILIAHINNSRIAGLQLAPDGKIYVVKGYGSLGIISNPNNYGSGCNFISQGFNLNNICSWSLPNFIDSYKYKNGMVNCTPPSINAVAIIQDIPCLDECTGTALAITTEGTPPYTYTWSTVPVQTTQTATGLCAGNYTVTITDSKGVSGTASVTVVNNPKPVPVIKDTNFTLQCIQTFVSYQWYFNGAAISGATAQSYMPAQNGNYTVEVTDSNGCTGFSAAYNVVWVGLEEYINNNISYMSDARPNPNDGKAEIDYFLPSTVSNAKVVFTDLLGKTINETVLENGYGTISIDTQELPSGSYLYTLVVDGKTFSSKKMVRNK